MPTTLEPTAEEKRVLAAASNAIVKVGVGRGFVVASGAGDRFVITAAQCLRHLPPVAASHAKQRTYPALLGPLDDGKTPVAAECLFVDPIADIAVLGGPDSEVLSKDAADFEAFIAAHAVLPMTRTPLRAHRSAPGWLMTAAGEWKRCILTGCGPRDQTALTIAVVGPPPGYAPATSGSPLLDAAGRVVGVVSLGEVLNPTLPTRLPLAVVHQIVAP
jgi:hypothetical protein